MKYIIENENVIIYYIYHILQNFIDGKSIIVYI